MQGSREGGEVRFGRDFPGDEIVEYDDHPWFIGVQFHPELKSRPFEPHTPFASFIGAPAGVISLSAG